MSSGPGPGPVAAVHRILIVTALVATLFYAVWEARTGGTLGFVRAAVAFVVSVGIAVYLRSLRRLGAKLTPRD